MTDHLWNDDDVERGAAALNLLPWDASPEYVHTEAVLGAVLPAYTARLLRDLADEVSEQGIDGALGFAYVVDWPQSKADEVQPS